MLARSIFVRLTQTIVNEEDVLIETTYFLQLVTLLEIIGCNNVIWLNVKMDKTQLMNFLEGPCDLYTDLKDALDTESIEGSPWIGIL